MSPLRVCGRGCRAQQRAGAVWKSAVRASPRLEGTQPGRRGLPAGSPWLGLNLAARWLYVVGKCHWSWPEPCSSAAGFSKGSPRTSTSPSSLG